ncbi:MAG: hypothetical protein K0S15_550 [Solirubrobacterales bacterium]|nr:hypothetical protein [Solirubrobacterales bacterium]
MSGANGAAPVVDRRERPDDAGAIPPGIETAVTAVEAAQAYADHSPGITRRRELVWQDPLASADVGAQMAGLDYIQALISGRVPPPPLAVTLNFTPVEASEGHAIFEGNPGEEHYNPIGVVHGGYASTLLDSALGSAVHTTLAVGEAYTTLSLEVKMVRPITRDTGTVRVEAEVLHRGRRQATSEARLYAAETGKLLAHGTSTCMILGA